MNGPIAQETQLIEAAGRPGRPRLRLVGGAKARTGAGRSEVSLSAALPRYELGEMIGRGTFGAVYAARHRALGRDVAIKQLWPDLMREAAIRSRFAAEARLLASLDHQHIVRVYDYVEEGAHALVLEHMPGGTLHGRLRRGPVTPAAASEIALAALSGLEHAHQRGFVHCDVKPQNLLFTSDGVIKLADFGLATAIALGPRARDRAPLAGTPAFMAPEQIDRALGPVSAATDVWAVGALLYEMLAGRPPLPWCDNFADTLLQRVGVSPPPLREVAAHVSTALSDVVEKAVARLPADRFDTAAQFARELDRSSQDYPGFAACEDGMLEP